MQVNLLKPKNGQLILYHHLTICSLIVTRQPSAVTVLPVPAKAFKPPLGFHTIDISSSQPSYISDFSQQNLNGKELWHLTAPASIPISAIKDVALSTVQNGGPVLSHKEVDYGFMEDHQSEQRSKKLLLPGRKEQGYKLDGSKISKTLHLRQIVNLNGPAHSSRTNHDRNQATLTAQAPATKPVRQQPRGLKVRYTPFGGPNRESDDEDWHQLSDDDQVDRMDIDEVPATSSQTISATSPESQQKRKHKISALSNGIHPTPSHSKATNDESPRKRHKKHDDTRVIPRSSQTLESQQVSPQRSLKKHAPTAGIQTPKASSISAVEAPPTEVAASQESSKEKKHKKKRHRETGEGMVNGQINDVAPATVADSPSQKSSGLEKQEKRERKEKKRKEKHREVGITA